MQEDQCSQLNWRLVISKMQEDQCSQLNWRLVISKMQEDQCSQLNWRLIISKMQEGQNAANAGKFYWRLYVAMSYVHVGKSTDIKRYKSRLNG